MKNKIAKKSFATSAMFFLVILGLVLVLGKPIKAEAANGTIKMVLIIDNTPGGGGAVFPITPTCNLVTNNGGPTFHPGTSDPHYGYWFTGSSSGESMEVAEGSTPLWGCPAVEAYSEAYSGFPTGTAIPSGTTVTSTITKTYIPTFFRVFLNVVGGSASPASFSGRIGPGNLSVDYVFNGSSTGITVPQVSAQQLIRYAGYETNIVSGPANYVATMSSGCSSTNRPTIGGTHTCTITETYVPPAVCGNGVREGTEQCDTGASRGACPATCDTSCRTNTCAICGNSVVESGEQCDTGASRGSCPATCSTSCTTNTCSAVGGGLGWAWGGSDNGFVCGLKETTGVGWISMSSKNKEISPAGSIDYGVTIPLTDGKLSGYAWSENVGLITFDNTKGYLNGCPVGTCSAARVGDKIEGWARFVDIKKAEDLTNAGGWLGWIKLAGDGASWDDGSGKCVGTNDYGNTNRCNYGVYIDTATGKLGGYAWSDELGAIKFSGDLYGVTIPKAPEVTLTAADIELTAANPTLPQSVNLIWTVKNDVDSCTKSGGNWSGTLTNPVPASGNDSVQQALPSVTYTLTCNGPAGTTSKSVTVNTICKKDACDATKKCSELSTILPLGAYSPGTCSDVCTDDSQCASPKKKWTNWKEVAP